MLKRILIAALIWPLVALAGTYPSPTFQNLTVLGTFTASGNVGLPSLAAQAANTVVANVTASSASPTAFAMPSCSTSASALTYTTSTGFTCNTAINAAQLGGATFAAPGPIGSTTASTGAFTTISASSTVSGTGFSTYLASPPAIGTTTPAAGKFTTLQTTSAITPSSTSGIAGTTTNDNANAGSVGEYVTSSYSSFSLTNNTNQNYTSIILTAGDWDVTGHALFQVGAGATMTAQVLGISTTSATLPSVGNFWQGQTSISGTAAQSAIAPVQRLSLSSTTTVYIVGLSLFSGGTASATGFIRARRMR